MRIDENNHQNEISYLQSFKNGINQVPWKKVGACVMVIGIIATPLFGIALAPFFQDYGGQCIGDNCLSNRDIAPLISGTHFPSWYKEKTIFDSCVLTGVDLQIEGQILTTAEVMSDDFSTIETRQQAMLMVVQEIVAEAPDKQKQIFSGMQESFAGRCIHYKSPRLSQRSFCMGIDERYTKNHKNVLEIIENTLLSTTFKIQTPAAMEMLIQSLHLSLTEGLVTSSGTSIQGGHYREGAVIMQLDNVGVNLKDLIPIVRKKDPSAVAQFKKVYRKVFDSTDAEKAIAKLSSAEKRVFSLAFKLSGSDPQHIAEDMRAFAREYMQKIEEGVPPLVLADWVHMKIVSIHPFEDGNGRLARMLANAELPRGGIAPLFIFNEREYLQAIEAFNQGDSAAFRHHLTKCTKQSEKLGIELQNEEPQKRLLIRV